MSWDFREGNLPGTLVSHPHPFCFGRRGAGQGRGAVGICFHTPDPLGGGRASPERAAGPGGPDASGIPGGQWQMGSVGRVCVPVTKAQTSNTKCWCQTKANIEVDPWEEEGSKEKGFGEKLLALWLLRLTA